MATMQQKYHKKKSQTLKNRNCGFELTLLEFTNLLTRSTICDYTQVEFTQEGVTAPSIERIDASLPYHVDNCCMITVKANQLKNTIDLGAEDTIIIRDLDLLNKIKHTLANKSIEELTNKYKVDLIETLPPKEGIIVKEDEVVNTRVASTVEDYAANIDLTIAEDYIKFTKKHSECTVSFRKFKRCYLKKSCDWSGKIFDTTNHYVSRSYAKINTGLPFSDDNIVIVCTVLATIKKNNLFTTKELNKFNNM